ncbi:NAD(P)-dependent oxidoreductase [Taklimakanibacter lacteus]|uniref:NAD(P)-dependent oxidoreductase n=1 Tax=Taklimakanibacter lacteus TaxID=2268456 RepID=UPI000E664DE4
MAMKKVGLIGAGLMGHGIGKNIVTKGYELTVLGHRNRAPIDDLIAKGAKEGKTPRAVAEASDVVFLCVTGSPQVEDLIYRKDGLLDGMKPGLIIADCSTAEPTSTKKVAEAVHAKGGRFVDVPMVRTPKEAEEGKLGLMTGGDEKTLKEIRPILDCFADTIIHAGPVGAGHTLKLINNFIAIGTAAVVAEGIAAGLKAGVDMKALNDIVMAGGARSVMFERIIKVPLADDDSAAKFAIDNARKDVRYYTNMTETMPLASPVAEAVHQTLVLGAAQGYGQRYVPRLVNLACSLNGIKL